MLSSKEKRLYDIEYRRKNKEKIRARKKAYYEANKKDLYAKKRARVNDEFRARHAAYCRKPEYAERKRKYDRILRAIKKCGEFWESDLIITEILRECRKQEPNKNERLYAKLNVTRIVKRNNDKRLRNAIDKIVDGAGIEILQKGWTPERREILEEVFVRTNSSSPTERDE